MNIKAGWIYLSGSADFIFSHFMAALKPGVAWLFTGACSLFSTVFLTTAYMANKYDALYDHSEYMDQDLTERDDGQLIKFPDVCSADDGYYLLSKASDGKMEISKASGSLASLTNIKGQDDFVEDLDECMETVSKWAAKENYNFADEFYYASDVSYTEAVYVDFNDGTGALYKDITVDVDFDSLLETVEDHDSYNDDAKSYNLPLFKAEFDKARNAWEIFKDNRTQKDFFFDADDKLKSLEDFPKYKFEHVTGGEVLTAMSFNAGIGVFLSGVILGAGSGYRSRKEARQKKLDTINALKGRDNLDF